MIELKDVLKEWLSTSELGVYFRVDQNATDNPANKKWIIWLCCKFVDGSRTPMWAQLEIKSDRVSTVKGYSDYDLLASDPHFFKKVTRYLESRKHEYRDKLDREWNAK